MHPRQVTYHKYIKSTDESSNQGKIQESQRGAAGYDYL